MREKETRGEEDELKKKWEKKQAKKSILIICNEIRFWISFCLLFFVCPFLFFVLLCCISVCCISVCLLCCVVLCLCLCRCCVVAMRSILNPGNRLSNSGNHEFWNWTDVSGKETMEEWRCVVDCPMITQRECVFVSSFADWIFSSLLADRALILILFLSSPDKSSLCFRASSVGSGRDTHSPAYEELKIVSEPCSVRLIKSLAGMLSSMKFLSMLGGSELHFSSLNGCSSMMPWEWATLWKGRRHWGGNDCTPCFCVMRWPWCYMNLPCFESIACWFVLSLYLPSSWIIPSFSSILFFLSFSFFHLIPYLALIPSFRLPSSYLDPSWWSSWHHLWVKASRKTTASPFFPIPHLHHLLPLQAPPARLRVHHLPSSFSFFISLDKENYSSSSVSLSLVCVFLSQGFFRKNSSLSNPS